MRIVAATGNPGKLAEIQAILSGLDVELEPMPDDVEPAEETEDTFAGNALLKARAVVRQLGLPAIADDSGLEVDALGGEPGVFSARYAGASGSRDEIDAANNALLIERLRGVEDRRARFVAVVAFVTPDGGEWTARGTMEGRIIDEPRGDNGFGYDPHFLSEGETRTNAELPPDVKNARSHRGAALRALRPHVEAWIRGQGP
ncbi:MAG: RdgB/HAM1 family non-canonical purine NTP pyrophosphatase [Nitriliruptorales bacterium]|nr:RdgB/HAM1 family non-canonical purine NTP pyrophosphatase [Nitriliruptorales bacterium]